VHVLWAHHGEQGLGELPLRTRAQLQRGAPTSYTSLSGKRILTNQFSVTENERVLQQVNANGLPGVFFFYDISPLKVIYNEEKSSFLHFLTSVCAIGGGVFTVSGIIDSFVYHGHRALKKKIELGKFS